MAPASGRLVLVVLYVALCGVASVLLPSITKHRPGELAVSLKAARRMAAGEEIYRPAEGKAFTYPPLFAVPFVPLARLPERAARAAWYFVNLLLAGAAVRLVAKQVRPSCGPREGVAAGMGRARRIVLVAIVALLAGRFLISPIEYQGHDQVIFVVLLLAVASWDSPRRWVPGSWAGLAAAMKATPLLMLPVFLWERRWAAAGGLALAAAAGSFAPDVLFPRQDGEHWVASWYENFVSRVEIGAAADAQGAWIAWNIQNQSLAGTLHRLFTPLPPERTSEDEFDVSLLHLDPAAIRALTLALQALVLGLLAYITWRRHLRNASEAEHRLCRLGMGGAVMCSMLLLSPMSSKAHFCVLLAPITFIAADFLQRPRDPITAGAIGGLFLLGPLSAKDLIGRPMGNAILAYGGLTLTAFICLSVTAYVLARRSRARGPLGLEADGTHPRTDGAPARGAPG